MPHHWSRRGPAFDRLALLLLLAPPLIITQNLGYDWSAVRAAPLSRRADKIGRAPPPFDHRAHFAHCVDASIVALSFLPRPSPYVFASPTSTRGSPSPRPPPTRPPPSPSSYPTLVLTLTDPPLGETIPIRLFLGGFDLAPTFRDINKNFSTRYYLVLIEEENRRYFKQQVRVFPFASSHSLLPHLLPFTFSTLSSLRPFSAAPSSARDPR
ncbi:hypothetical protein FB451DRAFT_1444505 [Mycena latifolia]|nr:hypothetical protein FB451DRAFT_1444505 [Mycena latifolia]